MKKRFVVRKFCEWFCRSFLRSSDQDTLHQTDKLGAINRKDGLLAENNSPCASKEARFLTTNFPRSSSRTVQARVGGRSGISFVPIKSPFNQAQMLTLVLLRNHGKLYVIHILFNIQLPFNSS